jgi:hypothetical protein
MFRFGALAAGAALALAAVVATPAAAAPPPPCNNAPQITDPQGDGHHAPTDVVSAWLTEAGGRLQAVVKVAAATPAPEHDDAEIPAARYAFLYSIGPQLRYVRATVPRSGPATFDQGAYTGADFISAGATAGLVEPGVGTGGTVTIDVPAVPTGTPLIGLRVLTSDGSDFVDHAPGGASPTDSARGADYIVGSCAPAAPAATTTAVGLRAPKSVKGRKTVTVTGTVSPARAGVPVTITRTANGKRAETRATSAADGSFSARIAIGETSNLRAAAEGIGSPELTVTARSTVRIKVRRHKNGSATVTGTVNPKLPGRIQWLRTNAVKPSARTTTRSNGTFRLRLKSPRKGRYQVVFIPADERAERSTSNTGVIR